jgi:hypothetical protein
MSNPDVELAGSSRPLGRESLPAPNKVNRRLYMAVIIMLGLVLLIGVIGWLILAAKDKTFPDGLGVILGTVAGGLVGMVSADNSDK